MTELLAIIIGTVGMIVGGIFIAFRDLSPSYNAKRGYIYINGTPVDEYLNNNRKSKAIYDQVMKHGHSHWSDSEINELLDMGAGAVLTARYRSDIIVVIDKAIIAYGETGSAAIGVHGQIYFGTKGWDLFRNKLFERNVIKNIIGSYQTTTPAKEKSVVGNAIAGAVIAGGVGAVVGAVNAASHNANAKDTVKTHYIHDSKNLCEYYMFRYYKGMDNSTTGGFEIGKMYFSNDIIKGAEYNQRNPLQGISAAFNCDSNS